MPALLMPHCPVTVVQRYRDGVCSLLFHFFSIICHPYIPLHLEEMIFYTCIHSLSIVYGRSLALAVQCETMHGVYEFRRGFCTLVLHCLVCVSVCLVCLALAATVLSKTNDTHGFLLGFT